jgi:hypothetical protein
LRLQLPAVPAEPDARAVPPCGQHARSPRRQSEYTSVTERLSCLPTRSLESASSCRCRCSDGPTKKNARRCRPGCRAARAATGGRANPPAARACSPGGAARPRPPCAPRAGTWSAWRAWPSSSAWAWGSEPALALRPAPGPALEAASERIIDVTATPTASSAPVARIASTRAIHRPTHYPRSPLPWIVPHTTGTSQLTRRRSDTAGTR